MLPGRRWIFGSATEVVVIEVVLRQVETGWAEVVRMPLLVIGIWGMLWMLGLLASYRVRPHVLMVDRVRIRGGARTWVELVLAGPTVLHTSRGDVTADRVGLWVDEPRGIARELSTSTATRP